MSYTAHTPNTAAIAEHRSALAAPSAEAIDFEPKFFAHELLAERGKEWAWVADEPEVCNLDVSRQYNGLANLIAMALVTAFTLGILALFNAHSTIMDTQFVDAMDQLGSPVVAVTDGIGWAGTGAAVAVVVAVALIVTATVRFVSTMSANKAVGK